MDEPTIRRYLSESRVAVLEIIDEGGVRDATDVARSWLGKRGSLSPAHAQRLPRIAGQLVWQLANLGWIERSTSAWVLTDLGRHARSIQQQQQQQQPAMT